MKISIIVPVYNVTSYIEQCIQSVMAQSYTDVECLLIDDCGTDDSMIKALRLLEKYNGPIHFKIYHHSMNKGLSEARNTGIMNATGEYLFFLDSDDELLVDSIANLAKPIKEHPQVELVQGCMRDNKKDMYYSVEKIENSTYIAQNTIIKTRYFTCKYPVTATNKLVKRSFIIINNLFFQKGLYHEDLLWTYNLVKSLHYMAFCNTITYIYNYSDTSIMRGGSFTVLRKRIDSYRYIFKVIETDMLMHDLYQYRSFLYYNYLTYEKLVGSIYYIRVRIQFYMDVIKTLFCTRKQNTIWDIVFYLHLLPPLSLLLNKRWYQWRFKKVVMAKIENIASQ